jgi:cytochrome c oxidase cbb3-type subunit 3
MRAMLKPGFALLVMLAMVSGCGLPGRPKEGPEVPRPEAILDFDRLYGENCAGCHGLKGHSGSATNLANPVYQAMVDDATLRNVTANGVKGSLMPGFGKAAGGFLTERQIDVLVQGMRERWSQKDALAGQSAPTYGATRAGDAAVGQQVYGLACARCHGADAGKPGPAGSILDGSFLALVTPQSIRTTILAGRPDFGQPDWRNLIPGRAMTDAEVTDVTAWLVAQRPQMPGQPYPNTRPASERPGEHQPTLIETAPRPPKR